MPPKKPTSEAASGAPPSRRSARIADKPKAEAATNGEKKEAGVASNKRPAESTANGDEDSKKTKKDSTAKTASKKATSTAAAKEEEKAAEAPADAEPETGPRGQLKKGDKLPKITLQDNAGKEVDVSSLTGEKGAVIFLYPKADTPGCTTQACGYRDNFDEISDLGYEIYGLSKDKPEAQQKWINKKELKYRLLCDPESKLIKRLGAFVAPNNTKRSHFIFEKGSGKLVDIALGVKPADDPSNVLKFLKEHHK